MMAAVFSVHRGAMIELPLVPKASMRDAPVVDSRGTATYTIDFLRIQKNAVGGIMLGGTDTAPIGVMHDATRFPIVRQTLWGDRLFEPMALPRPMETHV